MPKKKEHKKKELKRKSSLDLNQIISYKYQILISFAVIALVFLIYFAPMYFGGQTFESGDIITSKAATTYIEKERDGYTLWNPNIFCGMPSYAIALDYKWFNLVYVAVRTVKDIFISIFSTEYAQWTLYLLALALSTFLLIKYLTNNFLIALFGALATAFSSGLMLFILIGHVTKLVTLGFYPLIFLLVLRLNEKFKFRDFALLIIVLQISIQGFHVQVIFYVLFALLIYYMFYLVRALVQKEKEEFKKYLKSGLTFFAALCLASLMQIDNFTQIIEYNAYSTRGTESILEIEKNGGDKGTVSSDFYNYATEWSFSPGEIMTFVIPSFYGFGNSKYAGPLTQGNEVHINTYFGQMRSVDIALYMGIVVLFLAFFSIYANWKNPFVQYLTLLIVISLLISFGRNFSPVYDLMFNWFPGFNKFRVPSMILILVQISVPILAALGIQKIISHKYREDKKINKLLLYSSFTFTGLFVAALLFDGVISSWFAGRITDYSGSLSSSNPNLAQQFNVLSDYITEMFINDTRLVFFILTLSGWALVAFRNGKINSVMLIIILTALTVFDLVRVDKRAEKYSQAHNSDNLFIEPEYIKLIKQQNDKEPYRIFNVKQDGSNGSINRNLNFNSYFLQQDFYGYSAIKPRSYQNFMDVLGPGNPNLWNMLNVKYIIGERMMNLPGLSLINKTNRSYVYKNLNAFPRFYFVDSVEVVEDIDAIKNIGKSGFSPEKIAFVTQPISIEKPDSTANIIINKYADEKIELDVTASGNNLLFWGDTHIPTGWHAYIDDNETEIIKVNHGFNGIIIPEGNHKVKMVYLPDSFVISKYIVLILSSLTFLVLFASIWIDWRKKE